MNKFMRLKVDFWWVWMPNWWFLQTRFEDQTINCKQMPKVQKHAKTVRFSMILRVRSIGRWKKKLWKNHEKLKLKPDMHVWWMFDWFWIDFQSIWKIWNSFLDANWLGRSSVMKITGRASQMWCSGEKNAALRRLGNYRNPPKSSQNPPPIAGRVAISPKPPL